MEAQTIPDEILFRAETLGHLPDEYADSFRKLIRESAEGDETSLVKTIDYVASSVQGISLFFVLKPFIKGNDAKIKNAFFRSKELMRWTDQNKERVLKIMYGS